MTAQPQPQQQQPQNHPPSRTGPAPSPSAPAGATADPTSYEQTHVHSVYESIAPHFSATRHKPWPRVASFLAAQPPGSVGLDVGCGNGKYLGVNRGVYLVGSDRSAGLVGLAMRQRVGGGRGGDGGATTSAAAAAAGEEQDPDPDREGEQEKRRIRGEDAPPGGSCADAMLADGLALPFPAGRADFAISVAVIHHLSTRARRQDSIRALLGCVVRRGQGPGRGPGRGSGEVLMFVWALEQGSSRRGWDEGGEQDLLVPWVMKGEQQKQKPRKGKGKGKGETAVTEGGDGGDGAAKEKEEKKSEDGKDGDAGAGDRMFKRYYHLYRKGELEEDVVAAGGEVVESGYERDNWWAIARNVD